MKKIIFLFLFLTSYSMAQENNPFIEHFKSNIDPPLSNFVNTKNIFFDTIGKEIFEFHTLGFLNFGIHTNTFKITNTFFRLNFNIKNMLQIFVTINATRDTHVPEKEYPFMLTNIGLLDYGLYLEAFKYKNYIAFFISVRGASTYTRNQHTYSLLPHYYYFQNPADVHQNNPDNHLNPVFLTAPGLRVGFRLFEDFTIGYSQGDVRHIIPMSILAVYEKENFYIRSVTQIANQDPNDFESDHYRVMQQISLYGSYTFKDHHVKLHGIFDFTYSDLDDNWVIRNEEDTEDITIKISDRAYWYRLETAVTIHDIWIFSFRNNIKQFMKTGDLGYSIDLSFQWVFFSMASLGFTYSYVDGVGNPRYNHQFYIGTRINLSIDSGVGKGKKTI